MPARTPLEPTALATTLLNLPVEPFNLLFERRKRVGPMRVEDICLKSMLVGNVLQGRYEHQAWTYPV